MDVDDAHIGRRVREIRAWRGMSQNDVAGLAGITGAYLSYIERGLRPVTKRSMLEALANALRVSPLELTGKPYPPAGEDDTDAHAALLAMETALECYELGVDPEVPVREWPQISRDVELVRNMRHVTGDYAAIGMMTPKVMAELHALYVREPAHRKDALLGLIHCYYAVCSAATRLGGRGLPLLAARFAQQCARELGEPEWIGYTAFLRATTAGELSRPHQYQRSVAAADELRPHLNQPDVMQEYGMLHLSAALAAATQGDRDTEATHLAEAQDIADRQDDPVGLFGQHWFGAPNVGIWRVSLAVEAGEGPRVAELARDVHPELIPSPSRQADFYCDLGRSLLSESRTRDQGLDYLLHAERLAPQAVHTQVFVREAVSDALRRAQRNAGGRELRGLAFRMRIAPNG